MLLSNIVRSIIYEAIQEYQDYLLSFSTPELRAVKDIIRDERENPVHYEYQNAFLIVKMVEKDNKMVYVDPMPAIKDSLLKIFDELIKVSQQLMRPESTLRKTEKQFLPEMNFEDEKYRNALTEVSPVLSTVLEPLNVIAEEFDQEYIQYLNLNYN